MKHVLFIAVTSVMLILLPVSCIDFNENIPLPDLDPNTPGGGEILIFEVDDLLTFSSIYNPDYGYAQFEDVNRTYDVNNDGIVDFRLFGQWQSTPGTPVGSSLNITFGGELLYSSILYFGVLGEGPVFLPAEGLSSGSAHALWAEPNKPLRMASDAQSYLGGFSLDTNFPAGINYLPTRTAVGNDYYYGWLEIATSDINDEEYDEFLYISRFGISQTPGLRIRMGQE